MALDFQNKGTPANSQCQLNSLPFGKKLFVFKEKENKEAHFCGCGAPVRLLWCGIIN